MRDQFVGDVGDFGKYGLLRRLIGLTNPETPVPDLTLGVVWYYRRDEPGDDTNLVDRNRRACDPDLWDELGKLIQPSNRLVRRIEQSQILSAGTRYFRDLLSFGASRLVINAGSIARIGWSARCIPPKARTLFSLIPMLDLFQEAKASVRRTVANTQATANCVGSWSVVKASCFIRRYAARA